MTFADLLVIVGGRVAVTSSWLEMTSAVRVNAAASSSAAPVAMTRPPPALASCFSGRAWLLSVPTKDTASSVTFEALTVATAVRSDASLPSSAPSLRSSTVRSPDVPAVVTPRMVPS